MMMDLVVAGLDELHERVAGRFARAEPRARVREYVSGLVTGLERKNGWTLAEWAGEVGPDGMQRLLRRADWDVDGVRDDVRAYVVEQLGEPDGVLIADDTGFLKKGTRSACHRFLILPSDGPLNLAVAVGAVLMDRRVKRTLAGLEGHVGPYNRVRSVR